MNIIYLLLILFVGLSIFYLKAPQTRKSRFWNVLLFADILLFLSPLISAYADAFPDGNMWSDNGSGAILWSYFLLFPLCLVILVVLLAVKSKLKNRATA